jgi:hypothetical protein
MSKTAKKTPQKSGHSPCHNRRSPPKSAAYRLFVARRFPILYTVGEEQVAKQVI